MGGDIGMSNHRLLGADHNRDYDFSWYLEEDGSHPTLMNIVTITLRQDGAPIEKRHSYPIKVLANIAKELKVLRHSYCLQCEYKAYCDNDPQKTDYCPLSE